MALRIHHTKRTLTIQSVQDLIKPVRKLPASAALFECNELGDLIIAQNPDRREWITPRDRAPVVLCGSYEFTCDAAIVIRTVICKRARHQPRHYALAISPMNPRDVRVMRLNPRDVESYPDLEALVQRANYTSIACMKQPLGDNLPHFFLVELDKKERHDVLQFMLDYHRLMFPLAPLPVFDHAEEHTKWSVQPYTAERYCTKSINPCTFVPTGEANDQ